MPLISFQFVPFLSKTPVGCIQRQYPMLWMSMASTVFSKGRYKVDRAHMLLQCIDFYNIKQAENLDMNCILKPVNTTLQKVPFGSLKLAWCVDLQTMQDRDQCRVIWGVSEFVMGYWRL